MRARLRRDIEVAVPAGRLWDYVTDWPRQAEWVPKTHVERVDDADRLGGRIRAWTGLGTPSPGQRGTWRRGLGFWDPMTITAWQRGADGGGRCEVLHRGAVVKGEGEFVVEALGPRRSRFVWAEYVVVPLGPVGALGWRVVRPLAERVLDLPLRRMRAIVEREDAEQGDQQGQRGQRPS